jgi:hypothetical protein
MYTTCASSPSVGQDGPSNLCGHHCVHLLHARKEHTHSHHAVAHHQRWNQIDSLHRREDVPGRSVPAGVVTAIASLSKHLAPHVVKSRFNTQHYVDIGVNITTLRVASDVPGVLKHGAARIVHSERANSSLHLCKIDNESKDFNNLLFAIPFHFYLLNFNR